MRPWVNLTLPVFNEVAQLALSTARLMVVLDQLSQWRWELVMADNGSTDGTFAEAQRVARAVDRTGSAARRLADTDPAPCGLSLRTIHLPQPGRGEALKTAWLGTDADVVSYMDIDLSTDLAHLPELIRVILEGEADLAIGSRLLPASQTTRGWKREWISRCYNQLLRRVLGLRTHDAQCGFKALSRAAARALLPQVEDRGFFFDTELLALAQQQGWRIAEIPVRWVDDPDSRVRLFRTIRADLAGVWRLRRSAGGRRAMVRRAAELRSPYSARADRVP
ncbi:MAG: glycosyltransferase [Verrucomicrobia bacterium]|nr:glycosyltransferase [Verrucomicrobiota bacterium]